MSPNQIRALRCRLGLSQLKFGELLGVHRMTVTKWEGGTIGLSATTAKLLRLLDAHGPKVLTPGRRRS